MPCETPTEFKAKTCIFLARAVVYGAATNASGHGRCRGPRNSSLLCERRKGTVKRQRRGIPFDSDGPALKIHRSRSIESRTPKRTCQEDVAPIRERCANTHLDAFCRCC
jgi:hypothetical protein